VWVIESTKSMYLYECECLRAVRANDPIMQESSFYCKNNNPRKKSYIIKITSKK